jgi:hypothetical protein
MNFELSADAKILRSLLEGASVGDTITYDMMSKAIGRDVREHSRSALGTARQGVLRDKGIVFGTEPGVGFIRLTDEEIVKSTESDRKRLQRTAKRSLKKLSVVNFAALSEEQKRSHIVASAQIGAVSMFSTASSAKKIESKVSGSTGSLPIGETLKLFGG